MIRATCRYVSKPCRYATRYAACLKKRLKARRFAALLAVTLHITPLLRYILLLMLPRRRAVFTPAVLMPMPPRYLISWLRLALMIGAIGWRRRALRRNIIYVVAIATPYHDNDNGRHQHERHAASISVVWGHNEQTAYHRRTYDTGITATRRESRRTREQARCAVG